MSSMRIVLVDPLGDVLFSGESWLASGPSSPAANYDGNEADVEAAPADNDADCPQTLRSGESGIFPVERAKPVKTQGTNDGADEQKRDERAA